MTKLVQLRMALLSWLLSRNMLRCFGLQRQYISFVILFQKWIKRKELTCIVRKFFLKKTMPNIKNKVLLMTVCSLTQRHLQSLFVTLVSKKKLFFFSNHKSSYSSVTPNVLLLTGHYTLFFIARLMFLVKHNFFLAFQWRLE